MSELERVKCRLLFLYVGDCINIVRAYGMKTGHWVMYHVVARRRREWFEMFSVEGLKND